MSFLSAHPQNKMKVTQASSLHRVSSEGNPPKVQAGSLCYFHFNYL